MFQLFLPFFYQLRILKYLQEFGNMSFQLAFSTNKHAQDFIFTKKKIYIYKKKDVISDITLASLRILYPKSVMKPVCTVAFYKLYYSIYILILYFQYLYRLWRNEILVSLIIIQQNFV